MFKKLTKAHLKTFFILFGCQIFNYGLVTINYRAVSQAHVVLSLGTDALNASLIYFVIKKIAKDDSHLEGWLGYVLGSLAGTYLGIFLSLYLLGK